MTKSLIVAGREFRCLGRGRTGKALLLCAGAALLVAIAAGGRSASAVPAGEGRLGASLAGLALLLSSLTACVAGALSFSLEEEGGMAPLLRSFGLSGAEYLGGKYAGAAIWSAAVSAVAIVLAATLAEPSIAAASLLALALSSLAASAVYAAWGAFWGLAGRSPLSAAGSALAFWLITVFAYEGGLWALLPALPYRIAKPALAVFLSADPAEALRLGTAFLAGRGAVYGPEFYYWQRFLAEPAGIACALALLVAHVALPLALAAAASRRRS
jgi:Cu-processing system permease protein